MSRYAVDPPDEDRYEQKPIEDIDVPDFSAPDSPEDVAENLTYTILSALTDLEQEIAKAPDFERGMALWTLAREAERRVVAVNNGAAAKVNTLIGVR